MAGLGEAVGPSLSGEGGEHKQDDAVSMFSPDAPCPPLPWERLSVDPCRARCGGVRQRSRQSGGQPGLDLCLFLRVFPTSPVLSRGPGFGAILKWGLERHLRPAEVVCFLPPHHEGL